MLVATVAGVRALWEPDLVLDGVTWLKLVVLSIPASLDLLLPAAGLVAGVAVLARWVEEGSWTGMRAVGVSGRALLSVLLVIGLLTGASTAACSLVVTPLAHRVAFRVLDDPLLRVGLWLGRTVVLGSVEARPERLVVDEAGVVWMEDLLVVMGDRVGSARRARVVRTAQGAALDLRDGVLLGGTDDPWRLEWTRWVWTLPEPTHRLELMQRSTPELRETARRTEEAGGDADYEWAVYYKRWLHPLAALFLPLAALPLGVTRRPATWTALVGLGYLVAVRASDLLAGSLGPGISAAGGVVYVVVLGAVLWARWRER